MMSLKKHCFVLLLLFEQKNMLHWIKGKSVQYNSKLDEFSTKLEEESDTHTVIQSPVPLSKGW